MKEKVIVFDAGSLIAFSMNCTLSVFRKLKEDFKGKFIIPKSVEYEIITRPMSIKKYKLGAFRLKALIDEGVLEFPSAVDIKEQEIKKRAGTYLKAANNLFFRDGRAIHLIDDGESACLAVSSILSERGIENVISIDERTTRMLCEKVENLKTLLATKLHTKIDMKGSAESFKKFRFIRSSELIYVAFKKKLIKNQNKEFLDALLYAMKFKGCAISAREIKEIEKL